jgi:hypothetical protein
VKRFMVYVLWLDRQWFESRLTTTVFSVFIVSHTSHFCNTFHEVILNYFRRIVPGAFGPENGMSQTDNRKS